MTVNESVQFKVIIIFTKWIDESLSNFEPAEEESELDGEEERIEQIQLGSCLSHWQPIHCLVRIIVEWTDPLT